MFLCLFFMIMIMIIILSKQTKDINCEQGFEDHLSQKTHKTVDFCSVTSVLLTTRYIHTLANKNVFYGKKKEQKKHHLCGCRDPQWTLTLSRASPLADLYIAFGEQLWRNPMTFFFLPLLSKCFKLLGNLFESF